MIINKQKESPICNTVKPPYVEQCLAARAHFPIKDTSITKIPLYLVSHTRLYDTKYNESLHRSNPILLTLRKI
jgi:hypothetical protein